MRIIEKRFKIDSKSGTTVCFLTCEFPQLERLSSGIYNKQFISVTKLREGDNYNEQKGRDIAFYKAFIKARSFERKICNELGDVYLKAASDNMNIGQNLKSYSDACLNEINDAYSKLKILMFG